MINTLSKSCTSLLKINEFEKNKINVYAIKMVMAEILLYKQ